MQGLTPLNSQQATHGSEADPEAEQMATLHVDFSVSAFHR